MSRELHVIFGTGPVGLTVTDELVAKVTEGTEKRRERSSDWRGRSWFQTAGYRILFIKLW